MIKPLGQLADSIKKWDGITVPYGIEDSLTQIANGVKAFTLAFAGGWSLNMNTQDSINASNNQVIDAINALRADLNAFYSDDEKEIALYLNSKKVASTLAKDMNRQLAVLQKRGAY